MTSLKKMLLSVLAGTLVLIPSCTSLRANMFLIRETTPQEKAALLFKEGLSRYNEDLIERNDLKAIPKIRGYFADALAIDPMHPQAAQYIETIDSFRQKTYESYLKTATTLYAKEKRTEVQDYEMVLAVKKASDIKKIDLELAKLKADTKEIRTGVIQTRVDRILALEPKMMAEKNQLAQAKLLKDTDKLVQELQNIDPANKDAEHTRKEIDMLAEGLAQKDIESAKAKLAAKKYADAETAVLRAEKTLATVTLEPNKTLQTLKYQIYYSWSANLLDAKKYQTATDKANLAIMVNKTQEAVALRTKIGKAASVRDYDADIADILDSVDASLSRGDTATAQTVINTNLPKLKNQANKNSLSAKTEKVAAQVKTLYQDGISRYNEEDYEGARGKFAMVVKTNPDYEQAQAYLDRTNTKIRALLGKD